MRNTYNINEFATMSTIVINFEYKTSYLMTIKEILKHLRYTGAPDRKLKMDLSNQRELELISTDYFFDIAGYGPVPPETVRDNVLQEYGINKNDNVCYFHVDDIAEAISLFTETADQLDLDFTEEHKKKLLRRGGKGSAFILFIIERPIYG
jgi:hypothetical protein